MLTKKWALVNPRLRIAGHEINVWKMVNYLGVTLDQRLTFTPHVGKVSKSAAEAARAIGRLLLNIGGSSYHKRLLLSTVVTAKLMYASSVWGDIAFMTAKNRQKTGSAQRLIALRIIHAYRTVSDDAALMLAKTPPMDLLASDAKESEQGKEQNRKRQWDKLKLRKEGQQLLDGKEDGWHPLKGLGPGDSYLTFVVGTRQVLFPHTTQMSFSLDMARFKNTYSG